MIALFNRDNLIQIKTRTIVYLRVESHKVQITLVSIAYIYSCVFAKRNQRILAGVCECVYVNLCVCVCVCVITQKVINLGT